VSDPRREPPCELDGVFSHVDAVVGGKSNAETLTTDELGQVSRLRGRDRPGMVLDVDHDAINRVESTPDGTRESLEIRLPGAVAGGGADVGAQATSAHAQAKLRVLNEVGRNSVPVDAVRIAALRVTQQAGDFESFGSEELLQ